MTGPAPTPPASLSVITPSYDYERFLLTCLRSVRTQPSGWPVQHVVVDDGSRDGSWAVVERELHGGDAVRQENRGLSRTLDRALSIATGDVVCWLNADDFHLPWAYATAQQAFALHPDASIVYGDTVFVDDDSRLLRLVPQPAFDRRVKEGGFNMFHVPSVFWRRDALPAGWTFDASMQLYMDLDLWLALTPPGAKVVKVDAVLSAFRRHSSQISAMSRSSDAAEVRRLADRYDLERLRGRDGGGWTRGAHLRHAIAKVLDGGALRQLRVRRLRGTDLDWTGGAVLPDLLSPPAVPRVRVRTA